MLIRSFVPLPSSIVHIQGEAFLKELWSYIVVELLKAIETEHNNDVLGEELHSLGKCIEILGTGCLTQDQMNEVVKVGRRWKG